MTNKPEIEIALEAALKKVREHFYYKADLRPTPALVRPYPRGYGEVSAALQNVNEVWEQTLKNEERAARWDN